MITRTPVRSSSIASIGYDPATKVMEVEFTGGRVYRHADVPSAAYENLLGAKSVGSWYRTNVQGRYAPPKERA